jgi:DNA-binding NarL/FixJ family response regulator
MRILLIDDHQFLCVSLADQLKKIAARISSSTVDVISVFTLADAINEVSKCTPDIIFLDLNLGDGYSGAETLKKLQENINSDISIVIYTGLTLAEAGTTEIIRQCLRDLNQNGNVKGIIMKSTDLNNTFTGLERILSGEYYYPNDVVRALAEAPPPASSSSNYHLGLSAREWSVANCLTRGLPNKAIAHELKLTQGYVGQVTKQIYDKLGVRTRTGAAMRVKAALDDSERNFSASQRHEFASP